MVNKARGTPEEGTSDRLGVSARERQPHPAANYRRTIFGGISVEALISQLQPLMEASVRDAVSKAMSRVLPLYLNPSVSPSLNLSGGSGMCHVELKFVGEILRTLYHGSPIETVCGTPLQIVLVDCVTGERVISGPLSSLKVELVVLCSEFSSSDEWEDWTADEFDRSVKREREGRRPLLMGDTNVILTGGVGELGTVMFTDNSSWTRTKTFRLGGRVTRKMQTETRVKEAVSNPFSVKDHRGEKLKKRHPPFPHDDLWRLEHIRKDGPLHDRLRSYGIVTVIDFLWQYEADPSTLKRILGPGVSAKSWNAITNHAKDCVVDDSKLYTCNFVSENVVLFFNSIYRAVGASFGGSNFVALENLTLNQKGIVESLKSEAHKKRDEWLLVDNAAACAPNIRQDDPSNGFPVVHQGHYGVAPAPIVLPTKCNYGATGYPRQENWQSPKIIQPFGALDPRKADNFCQGEQGYNAAGAALMECLLQDKPWQWQAGSSSSCPTWTDCPTPHGVGQGMNSNRSSCSSLDILGATSTMLNMDYKVVEQLPPPPPHPHGSDDALF
ncbi:hypothetical protein MLD38_020718 [Melastoma candidum]|uniref:Uncharacterized protein n=1 Tax=Melastoma candidum TaxID=119954 RepID=A0ACB9QF30_9MYRT|nr:hypothetical protein MLD38_020718 [Melastoma candidum]